jgi:hypothetical protein
VRYKLLEGDLAVVVLVVAEHVLHHIVEFVGVLVQDLYQCCLYLLLVEGLAAVVVVLRKDLEHAFADEVGELVVGEAELEVDALAGGGCSLDAHFILKIK